MWAFGQEEKAVKMAAREIFFTRLREELYASLTEGILQGWATEFVWNGSAYVDYGVIDIHDPSGEGVIRGAPVQAEDVDISGDKARFRLREGWEGLNFSESVIDQVKLYAVDDEGEWHLCPLMKAVHSEQGKVLSQLQESDDIKVQMLLLETIDLKFAVPHQNALAFVFIIEGNICPYCNQPYEKPEYVFEGEEETSVISVAKCPKCGHTLSSKEYSYPTQGGENKK